VAGRSRNPKGFLFYLGRWAWVFLVTEIGFLAFVPVFLYNQFWQPQVIACGAAMFIGVLSAFFARLLLPKQQIVLRFFLPWSCLLLSLMALDALTEGEAGFGIFAPTHSYASLLGLIPTFLGTSAIVLAMLAFSKERRAKKRTKQRAVAARSSRTQSVRRTAAQPRTRSTPTRSRAGRAQAVKPLRLRSKGKGNSSLHLTGSEEHRCPYCLEIVRPNDPRGVVICDICHAYHHKDCWDVTGRCQVPHQIGAT
jgi:hypothetical protein